MNKVFKLIRLVLDLGLISVLRVTVYKFSIKYKFNKAFHIQAEFLDENIFLHSENRDQQLPEIDSWLNRKINNSYFDIHIDPTPPDWFFQIFTGKTSSKQNVHWSLIPDFDPALGDIKPLWDLSRFDWLMPLSQQASKGDIEALTILNNWIQDWQKKNPPYFGLNWKCGQEASIRVMHLLMGAYLLNQLNKPTKALVNLIIAHLKRIEPTISYAIGQNNNHGTSEAAALYMGGGFLMKNGYQIGLTWQKKGQMVLEDRIKILIGENGTFSQYSLNYHRLMLDTINCCEFLRTKLDLPELSNSFYQKAVLATDWLFSMIDGTSGDGPNVGANDGARIIPLTNCSYRDFRPTVQLAMIIFKSALAYPSGMWDEQFQWLGISITDKKLMRPESLIADEGGFAMLRVKEAFVCLRYPRYKFRPSQNDLLHLDLWVKGKNIFKDGGSFSYNSDPEMVNYLGSIAAHNSIQFDKHEPMEKISRFLYADWVKTNWISEYKKLDKGISFGAGYTDRFDAKHKRMVVLSENMLVVEDEITNFKKTATLRWRLSNENWEMTYAQNVVILHTGDINVNISITCTQDIVSCNLEQGYESLYYMNYKTIPVLQLTVEKKCCITTTVKW